MIKRVSIVLFVLLVQLTYAQKAQKIGYIDRDYVLENIPEYATAQSKLDSRVKDWNAKLDKFKKEIDAMKLSLSNEKALLTSDLVADREEDINIKETELKRLQEAYFGTSGDLFLLRKQLVKPIQDQIFNAIQEISKTKKYDIIFDKSSNDIVMLYSNPKYDVSELVLRKIVKGRKKKENAIKKTERETAREKKKEAQKKKINDKLTRREQLKEKVRLQNEARAAKRAALKKANEEKRQKRLAELKAQREARKNKTKEQQEVKEKKGTTTKEKVVEETETKVEKSKAEIEENAKKVSEKVKTVTEKQETKVKTKNDIRAEKLKALEANRKAKKAKRDSLRKVAKQKRAKKMAEIEARKKKLEENK